MPKTRAPATLLAQCAAQAEAELAQRLKELQRLAPQLALLQPLLPALKDQRCEIWPSDLRGVPVPSELDGSTAKTRPLALRIDTASWSREAAWMKALLFVGFEEVHRTEGPYAVAFLRKGKLLLAVDAPRDPVMVAHTAAVYARIKAAQAKLAMHQGEEVPA